MQRVDVFCPCAMGGDLNPRTVKQLNCRFVIGSANNQLSHPHVGEMLHERGIMYAPDYVANAGGLINVVDELEKDGYNKARVLRRVEGIKATIQKIIARSAKERKPASVIADRMAEEKFNKRRL